MKSFIKSKLVIGTLLTSMFMAGSASAEYISLDWQQEGDGLAFLDEDTGIEWLKFSETRNMSINEVAAELGSGGLFEGWRFPTYDEIISIVTDLTGSGENQYRYNSTQNSEWVRSLYVDFATLFGWTYQYRSGISWNIDYDYRSYGSYMIGDNLYVTGTRWRRDPVTINDSRNYSYTYVDSTNESFDGDYKSTSYGVYLVGDGGATLTTQQDMSLVSNNPNAAINAHGPTGAVSFALGLFGLAAIRRKLVRDKFF